MLLNIIFVCDKIRKERKREERKGRKGGKWEGRTYINHKIQDDGHLKGSKMVITSNCFLDLVVVLLVFVISSKSS